MRSLSLQGCNTLWRRKGKGEGDEGESKIADVTAFSSTALEPIHLQNTGNSEHTAGCFL